MTSRRCNKGATITGERRQPNPEKKPCGGYAHHSNVQKPHNWRRYKGSAVTLFLSVPSLRVRLKGRQSIIVTALLLGVCAKTEP
jgi:hypothetical protein